MGVQAHLESESHPIFVAIETIRRVAVCSIDNFVSPLLLMLPLESIGSCHSSSSQEWFPCDSSNWKLKIEFSRLNLLDVQQLQPLNIESIFPKHRAFSGSSQTLPFDSFKRSPAKKVISSRQTSGHSKCGL